MAKTRLGPSSELPGVLRAEGHLISIDKSTTRKAKNYLYVGIRGATGDRLSQPFSLFYVRVNG